MGGGWFSIRRRAQRFCVLWSRDPSALVREAAASNPNIAPRRLAALTADPEANVCERAIDTIRRLSQPRSRVSAMVARDV